MNSNFKAARDAFTEGHVLGSLLSPHQKDLVWEGADWAYNFLEKEMEEIAAENSIVTELLGDLVYAVDAQTFSEARVRAEEYLKKV